MSNVRMRSIPVVACLLGAAVFARGAGEPARWVVEFIEQAWKKGTVERSTKLGQEATVLAGAGRYSEAAQRLKQAAAAELAAGDGTAQKAAAFEYEQGASIMRAQQVAGLRDRVLVRRPLEEVLASLPAEQRKLIRHISEVAPRVLPVNIVRADVKEFIHAFAEGASRPAAHRNDPVASVLQKVRWDSAAMDGRIFLAAAGEDDPLVRSVRSNLEANGYEVFFYKTCSVLPDVLCKDATVGEYFASAGHALIIQTDASARSRFLPYEIAAAQRILKGQSLFLMVTPPEIMQAAKRGVTTAAALAIPVEVRKRSDRH